MGGPYKKAFPMTKSKKIKLLLSVAVILGVVSTIGVFIGYRSGMQSKVLIPAAIKKAADMSLEKVRQTSLKNGIKEWDLEAESAYLAESEKKLMLSMPSVTFFLKDGNVIFLTAEKGILKTDTKSITVTGDVKAKTQEYSLKANRLDYESEKKILSSNQPVVLFNPAFTLQADSMVMDTKTQKTLFKGHIKGIFSEKLAL